MPEVSARSEVSIPGRTAPSRFVCVTSASGAHAAWIHVAGELDLATSPVLQRQLQQAQLSARLIVLDLREVTFIDCSGLHVLLAADAGTGPTILVTGAVVKRLLELAGFDGQLPTVDLDLSEPEPALGLASGDPAECSRENGHAAQPPLPSRKA